MWFLIYLLVSFVTVTLKVAGTVTASWWLVLAPVWVPVLAALFVVVMFSNTRERE
jgi:hypothetical protein